MAIFSNAIVHRSSLALLWFDGERSVLKTEPVKCAIKHSYTLK